MERLHSGEYILAEDGKTPVLCVNSQMWAKWFETADRWVAQWSSPDKKVHVSTVFLALDHSYATNGQHGPPILWETLISGGEHDDFMERYSSYEDALNGHERAIMMVEESFKKGK